MKKITLSLIVLITIFHLQTYSQTTAYYDITFNSTWNAAEHNNNNPLPGGAHWSKLVGVNHNSSVSFYEIGQMMASQGIENVAEQGSNGAFSTEVSIAISNGNAQQYIDGNSLGTPTGDIIYEDLQVSDEFPLLTLVSMIAPSPDWFIGVSGLNLRDNGNWIPSIVINLYAIDAGTDSGATYTSSDSDNNEPISEFSGAPMTPPFNSNIIGTLTVDLDETLSNIDVTSLEGIHIFPNPSQGDLTISNVQNLALNSLTIYNVLGSVVKDMSLENKTSNSITLDLNDLNKGLYLIHLKNKTGNSITRKLIIE